MERRVAITLLCGLLAAQARGLAEPGADAPVGLGPRHADGTKGYSIKPPLGTTFEQAYSPVLADTWYMLEDKTRKALWLLSVRVLSEDAEGFDLKAYARLLPKKLRDSRGVDVEGGRIEMSQAAGKPALRFRAAAGRTRLYQQQVWVMTDPGRFAIVTVAGRKELRSRMDAVLDAVLPTLKVADLNDVRAREQDSLRGRKLVEALTDEAVHRVLIPEQWFFLRRQGKTIGFMKQTEQVEKSSRVTGYMVKTWTLIEQDAKQWTYRRAFFADAQRRLGRWVEDLESVPQASAFSATENGLRQDNLIVCYLTRGKAKNRLEKTAPDWAWPILLPRALQYILPRLIGRQASSSYGFAVYSSQDSMFSLYVIRVIGPEQIELGSRVLTATKVELTPAPLADTSTLWLAADGRLLRMSHPDGIAMEAATHEDVSTKFPLADALVRRAIVLSDIPALPHLRIPRKQPPAKGSGDSSGRSNPHVRGLETSGRRTGGKGR